MTDSPLTGIHHVTAFAKDPRKNVEFYTRVLGLRLVKKTVNFDDPMTYHLYYGDHAGNPGTLLTHFPHPNAKPGVHGSPELTTTVLSVPTGSLGYWTERLGGLGVAASTIDIAGEPRIAFADHDGMRFELVERDASQPAAIDGDVPSEHAIAGVDAMVAQVPDVAETASFLRDALGFDDAASGGGRRVLAVGDGGAGRRIELEEHAEERRATMGAGTVHHVAWRVPDSAGQADVVDRLRGSRTGVTPVLDRQYFRSIYFRVPGGVIFEVATDGPGFDADEPLATLGEALKLPPQYEPRRAELEAHLVALTLSE